MRVISILNLKGGVGKTFTAANMAYELYKRGYRVLLLDNDKQGNLSRTYGRYDAESICATARLLNSHWNVPEELIQPTDYDSIDIITSNMSLFGATWNLTKATVENQIGAYENLIHSTTEQGVLISERYDYCIIDNPPDIGINVINALEITDEVIIPVKIDEDALEGLDIVAEQIEDIKAFNPSIKLSGVVITIWHNTDGEAAGEEWLREYKNYKILGKIRYSKKVSESSFVREPIYAYSPCCAAAQDYKKLVENYISGK